MRLRSSTHSIPLALLLILAIIVYLLGFSSHLSLENLKEKEHFLTTWANTHLLLSALILFLLYVLAICLLLPACSVLTFFTGMIYPIPYALLLSIAAETAGACLFFIIVRYAIFPGHFHRNIIRLKKMRKEFQQNPFCYLLFLRFSHFTPAWLITTGAVLFKAPFWTFTWTTLLGAIPMNYLIIDATKIAKNTHQFASWDWHHLFTLQNKLLLFSLGVLSLAPIAIQKWKNR